jgi:hypothetical protein
MSTRQFKRTHPRIGAELALNWRHIRQFRQYGPLKGALNWRAELADGRNWRHELAEPAGPQHISTIVSRILARCSPS